MTLSDTDLEARLRRDLRARADDVPPAPNDLAELTRSRHRQLRRREYRFAGVALAAAVLLVGVPVVASTVATDSDRGQTAGPRGSETLLPADSELYDAPTRGGLAGDDAWLAAVAALPWWPDSPHRDPGMELTEPEVDTRHVAYADDVPSGRVALVVGSSGREVVQTPEQAFEAAKQFSLFTQVLSGLSPAKLKITLPGFHDLTTRYRQFEQACTHGNPERIKQSQSEIDFIRNHSFIVETFRCIQSSSHFKTRVTHHDTKISNVLFGQDDKGICVIDLDTVMPGYFISDVGDMLRTYLSPVSEEEKDFSKIEVREVYFKAILEGYLSNMRNELSKDELNHFIYSGMFMIYMQAIRFLTDYLNNDCYYGSAYEGHNYVRAGNQITLLKRLQEKEHVLNELVG